MKKTDTKTKSQQVEKFKKAALGAEGVHESEVFDKILQHVSSSKLKRQELLATKPKGAKYKK